jgi:hypothetical protein
MEFTAEKNQIILNKYWNSKNRSVEPSKKEKKEYSDALERILKRQSKEEFAIQKKNNNEIIASSKPLLEYKRKEKLAYNRYIMREILERNMKELNNKNKSFNINEIIPKLQTKYNNNLESMNINIEELFNIKNCIKILECIQKFTPTIKSSDLKYFPKNMRETIKKHVVF